MDAPTRPPCRRPRRNTSAGPSILHPPSSGAAGAIRTRAPSLPGPHNLMFLHHLSKYRDVGLLVLRIGIGVAFMVHGGPKLLAGPELWEGIAQGVGIGVLPTFFGFLAAMSEFFGGLLFALGLFFRPACFFLVCTMIGAITSHLGRGDGFSGYSHPLEVGILFLSMILIGPGIYSLDARLNRRRRYGF